MLLAYTHIYLYTYVHMYSYAWVCLDSFLTTLNFVQLEAADNQAKSESPSAII